MTKRKLPSVPPHEFAAADSVAHAHGYVLAAEGGDVAGKSNAAIDHHGAEDVHRAAATEFSHDVYHALPVQGSGHIQISAYNEYSPSRTPGYPRVSRSIVVYVYEFCL